MSSKVRSSALVSERWSTVVEAHKLARSLARSLVPPRGAGAGSQNTKDDIRADAAVVGAAAASRGI